VHGHKKSADAHSNGRPFASRTGCDYALFNASLTRTAFIIGSNKATGIDVALERALDNYEATISNPPMSSSPIQASCGFGETLLLFLDDVPNRLIFTHLPSIHSH